MLDLDAIATARARTLAQDPAAWCAAAWTAPFQALSARLSDGEVVDLLGMCSGADEMVRLTKLLMDRATATDLTPLDWLKREAAGLGLSPGDWVRRHAGADAR